MKQVEIETRYKKCFRCLHTCSIYLRLRDRFRDTYCCEAPITRRRKQFFIHRY